MYIADPLAYLALLNACRLNVSYRVHSALPCMAFGTPFIKLSYDERGVSLMKTVGFGEWNIDLVRSQCVVDDVGDRLAHLDMIAKTKEAARNRWNELRQTQDAAMSGFAARARQFSDELHDLRAIDSGM